MRAQLEDSLTLLRCDSFDLYQLHAVTDLAELDARSRAVEAILAARDEGLTRWVGITGHEHTTPAAQLEALRRYDLDTVMFPVYPRLWADPDYRRDAEALLEYAGRARRRRHGHQGGRRPAVGRTGGRPPTPGTSRGPRADDVTRGVRFALSTPGVHAFCTPGDTRVLTTALAAAADYAPLTPDERAAAVAAMAGESSIYPMAPA